MSSVAVIPTFILQIDGFVWEGLRLILSRTRFDLQGHILHHFNRNLRRNTGGARRRRLRPR
jgi:hypothetical protein